MERNFRTSLQGVVVSDKMDKTIVVEVETHKRHAKYLKRIKYSNKYYAHDEKNEAHVGDVVTIMGCRPLSATKRFRLVSIDQKAAASIKEAVEAEKAMEAQVEEVKAEVKVEEPKVEAPVVEAPKAEEVAPVAAEPAKKPAAKKAPAKKAAAPKADAEKPAAKKAPAKKAPAKKAPAKKAAEKAE